MINNGNKNETYEPSVLTTERVEESEATDTGISDEWDTAALARLVNFDDSPEIPSPIVLDEKEANSSLAGNSISQSELFDDPIEGKTQPGFHKRGINKAAATGGILFIGFAAVGLFLNNVFNHPVKKAPSASPTSSPTLATTPTPGTETGNLKTQIAIGKQADQIKAIDGSKSPKTNVAKKTQQTPPISAPSPSPLPPRTVAPPPSSSLGRTYSQPYRQYSPPPTSTPSPLRTVSTAAVAAPWGQSAATKSVDPKPQERAKEPEKVDPMQQWMIANRIGSYGGSDVGEKIPTSAPVLRTASTAQSGIVANAITIPKAVKVVSSIDGVPPSTQVEDGQSAFVVNPAEEASVLSGTPVRRLTVGGEARGQLVTPVIWAGLQEQLTNSAAEKFIVQLAEPLVDRDGGVAMPASTQLVVTAVVSESGLTQLSVTQAIVDDEEYALPPGAIAIRGNDGQPLMASKWGDKGGAIASGDATAFLFGSMSRVGQVLTQPDSESSTSVGGYGYSSTTASRSGGRNILGAVLDGGFTPLSQQILKRNEQRLKEITARKEIWYVRAGENVRVFVNRSFEF